MSRIYEHYLRDILKAVERIKRYTETLDQEAFQSDELRLDGVLFNLMTIGEAVKAIPEEMRSSVPEVRWRDIARFRDRVVHRYFEIDVEIVWEIISIHLPVLEREVYRLLQNFEGDDE